MLLWWLLVFFSQHVHAGSIKTLAGTISSPPTLCRLTTSYQAFCWGNAPLIDWSLSTAADTRLFMVSVGSCTVGGLDFSGRIVVINTCSTSYFDPGKGNSIPSGNFRALGFGAIGLCALDYFGQILCVGDGNLNVPIALQNQTFLEITVGTSHACAQRADGTVACWTGLTNQLVATQTPNVPFLPLAISAGQLFSCGLLANDSSIRCWGQTLPTGTIPSGSFTAISCAFGYACAIRDNQTVTCWGSGNSKPVPSGTFVSIMTSASYACALGTANDLQCWGNNVATYPVPPKDPYLKVAVGGTFVTGLLSSAQIITKAPQQAGLDGVPGSIYGSISASSIQCAVLVNNTVYCWPTADSLNIDITAPAIPPPPLAIGSLSVSYFSACGLQLNGTVYCWGKDKTPFSGEYLKVSMDRSAQTVANVSHDCAIRLNRTVECYSHNDSSFSYYGITALDVAPGPCTCIIDDSNGTSGAIHCFGDDTGGMVSLAPSGNDWVQIRIAYRTLSLFGRVCARNTAGRIKCWGQETNGEATPPSGGGFVDLDLYSGASCAVHQTGALMCWGLLGAVVPIHLSGGNFESNADLVVKVAETGTDAMLCGVSFLDPCKSLAWAVSAKRDPNIIEGVRIFSQFHFTGAVPSVGAVISSTSFVTLKTDPAASSTAVASPSGIEFKNSQHVTVQGLNFQNATQTALKFTSSQSVTVSSCSFMMNSATNGGAVSSFSSDVTFSSCHFLENHADTNGGGLYSQLSTLSFDGCEFTGNTGGGGGAMTLVFTTTFLKNNSTFTDNVAQRSLGGAIRLQFSSLTMTDGTFQNNQANSGGGAIFVLGDVAESTQQISLTNTVIRDNTAGASGGGIFLEQLASGTFDRIQMISNKITGASVAQGGGLAMISSTVNISNSIFKDNSVVGSGSAQGGGLWCAGDADQTGINLQLSASTFLRNHAVGTGGGLWSTGCNMIFDDANFTENSATDKGGGLGMILDDNMTISNSDFYTNNATYGGGIYVEKSVNNVILGLQDVNWIGNRAGVDGINGRGGALFLANCPSQLFATNVFQSNQALEGGGAIYFERIPPLPLDVSSKNLNSLASVATFSQNNASYSSDVSSAPVELWLNATASNVTNGSQFVGGNTPAAAVFSLFDWMGSVVLVDSLNSGAVIPVIINKTMTIRGALPTASIISGIADFGTALIFQGQPNVYQVGFSTVNLNYIDQKTAITLSTMMNITLLPCGSGQYYENETGLCQQCQAGFATAIDVNLEIYCTPCGPGYYSEFKGSTQCETCQEGKSSLDTTNNGCFDCSAGEYSNATSGGCVSCSPGEISEGGSGFCIACEAGKHAISAVNCTACIGDSVAPFPGSFSCLACVDGEADNNGMHCSCDIGFYDDGNPAVPQGSCSKCPSGADCTLPKQTLLGLKSLAGWWRPSANSTRYGECLSDTACVGGPFATQCGEFRTGPLCTLCFEGYSEWSGNCVPCKETNGGLVFAFLLVSFFLTGLLYVVSQSTTGLPKVFFYFVQTVYLFTQSFALMKWLKVFNLEPHDAVKDCILPLSPYQKLALAIFVPLLMLGELVVAMLLLRLRQHFIAPTVAFNWNPFIRTFCALYTFSYYLIMNTCFRYLNCVDIGPNNEYTVVYSEPGINCNDSDYKAYLGLVIAIVVIYGLFLPLVIVGSLIWGAQTDSLSGAFSSRWGVFFDAYRIRAYEKENGPYYDAPTYWWEGVVLIRRVSILAFDTVLFQTPVTKYAVFTALSFVYLVLHLICLPFADPTHSPHDNILESISLTLLFLTALILTGASANPDGLINGIIFLVAGVPTILFLIYYVYTRFMIIGKAAQEARSRYESSRASRAEKLSRSPSPPQEDQASPRGRGTEVQLGSISTTARRTSVSFVRKDTALTVSPRAGSAPASPSLTGIARSESNLNRSESNLGGELELLAPSTSPRNQNPSPRGVAPTPTATVAKEDTWTQA